jgi:hypothetical protein
VFVQLLSYGRLLFANLPAPAMPATRGPFAAASRSGFAHGWRNHRLAISTGRLTVAKGLRKTRDLLPGVINISARE